MNIQNTVNSREGLLYAKNQGGDIFNRLNKSTYTKSVVQKMSNMGVQAIREVRTKESIKNNRLTPFVQYEKQPANHSLKYLSSPKLASAKNNHSSLRGTVSYSAKLLPQCYSEHQGNFSLMMRLPDNIGLVGLAQSTKYISKQSQPLGVMPKRSSFSRQAPLTHELKLPFPAINSICTNRSSSKRIVLRVLLVRSYDFFCFSSCIGANHYDSLNVDGTNHYIVIVPQITMPCSAETLTEHLTNSDSSSIEVAMYKYTFLIGKGKTRLSEINPIRLISVLAKSENEARLLAGNRHLVFVARQEVAYV